MRKAMQLGAGFALLSLAGCGTTDVVLTQPSTQKGPASGWTYYGSYPLPVSTFTVEIKDGSAGGGGAGAGAASATQITITNTNTSSPATPPTPAAAAGGGKGAPGCDDLKKAYGALRQRYILDIVALGADIANLRDTVVKGGVDPAGAVPRNLRPQVTSLTARREGVEQLALQAAGLGAQISAACKTSLAVTITQGVAGDEDRTYRAYVKDDDWSRITLNSKADANGLITSLSTTAEDATGSVFVAAVQSVMSFEGAFGALPSGGFSAVNVSGEILQPIEALLKFVPPVLPALDLGPQLPKVPRLVKFTELWRNGSATSLDVGAGVTLSAACTRDPPAESAPPAGGDVYGLATSMQRACFLTATWSDGQPQTKRVPVNVLDSQVVVPLPVPKTRLVSRKTTYGFTDGRLTSVDYDKPSTALAVATLPGTAITSGLSAFSTALQGRKGVTQSRADNLNAQAAIGNAQAAILDAQAKVLTSQAALKKAEAAAAVPPP